MNNKLNSEITRLIEKYNLDSLEVTASPRELIVMLLSEIKKCSTANIKLDMVNVTEEDVTILEEMLNKIANEKLPPQYVTNKEYIYGNEFFVNENVLIPRQDTETLIEFAINIVRCREYKTLLDLCTGSGVIGISVSRNTDLNEVTLVDISSNALQVTRKNIELNKVKDRCNIVESNMFENLYKLNNKYDIIVSNPPYLTKSEMNEISEFIEKEPSMALYGGKDGLRFYRIIFEEARNFLNNGGTIAVEIGYAQAKDVIDIIMQYEEYTDISVIPDINNKDRVVVCHFQSK